MESKTGWQPTGREWVGFPGGELEGQAPRTLCPACRARLNGDAGTRRRPQALCFQCYRADLDRRHALRAAGALDTATEARFQDTLPFEPVNVARLAALRVERARARDAERAGSGAYAERRRRAQIAARHALQQIVAGIRARQAPAALRESLLASAMRAAELQLPDAWLPFVVSR